MKSLFLRKRTLTLMLFMIPLLVLFVYVALRSGPLAPVAVTVATVATHPLEPTLFGIGTVEARHTYKIGPTFSGRLRRLDIQVGDQVEAGRILGEMDPVDLDQRIRAQNAALNYAEARLSEARERQTYAQTQAQRYESLLTVHAVSEESAVTKRHELQVAKTGLVAAREELVRVRAEGEALIAQRRNLALLAPVAGLVTRRHADPGTTLVAGQAAVELINPRSLWINVRFDQIHARGLKAGQSVQIALRSQAEKLTGRVLRVEPVADAVTEEMLAKVAFDTIPAPLPAVGELAEVTVTLPALAAGPVIPNAAVQRVSGQLGVWRVIEDDLHFTPVTLGTTDLEGKVQVRQGLKAGDLVIVYSEKTLNEFSRIQKVARLAGEKS
jgi:RND family efflux transporter MFP subunit